MPDQPHVHPLTPNRPVRRPHARRGTVLVAVLVVLIVLSIVVTALTTLGARDQDTERTGLDGDRCELAAEAGMNMAVRELYQNSDLDGDGGIGTISNDGNSANDPTINSCRIVVTKSVSGPTTTITSTATGTNVVRKISMTLQ